MKLDRQVFGRAAQGQDLSLFVLDNEQGLKICVTDFGATLTRVYFPDKAENTLNLVLGYEDSAGVMTDDNYFGSTIGRYGNRIARGRFQLDDKTHQLACNDGSNHLHGGGAGFNKKVWDVADVGDCWVTFACMSPDGEEGYPGNLSVEVTYRLTQDNELVIDYRAQTDAATPLNLTNHTYWNLAGAGSGNVLDHLVTLHCEHYLPVDEELLPTGEVAQVVGTPFDFRTPNTIGSRISQVDGGYDHCFVQANETLDEPRELAKVKDPESGRTMTVLTTEPGVQFYSGNFLDGVQGIDGNVYGKHGAFCLEAQHFPDSPNRPDFPNTILRPGVNYRQKTVHRFSVSD